MDMVKTELGNAHTPKIERKPKRTRAQKVPANFYQTQDGQFSLDSVAAKFFVKSIPNYGKPLTINATVRTATGTVLAHKKIRALLTAPTWKPIEISASHIPELENNLIAINGVIKSLAPVVFTAEGAYVLPKRNFDILKLKEKFAACKAVIYVLKGELTVPRTHGYLA